MSESKKLPVGLLIKLGVVAIVVAVVAFLLLRGVDLRGWMNRFFVAVSAAGPWVFFTAMAVLPAFGAPMLVFYFTAGSAFAPTLGMPAVIGLSMLALTVNVALTYWLAAKAVRPLVERLLARFHYTVPQVRPENELSVAIMVRVTPGPPFFMQGYILGLAGVKFRAYLIASLGFHVPMGIACVVFGKAIFEGHGKLALLGLGLFAGAIAAVQIVRRRLAQRNAQSRRDP